ncbi:hypothetical protein ACQB60_40475 [Actinomycetota bacterium Odt1-20B]
MAFLRCAALRWVDDEPHPGLIEVGFTDAGGRQRVFVDKVPVFTSGDLGPDSRYPVEVQVLCDILPTGSASVTPDRARISVAPWGLESLDGHVEFEVRADQVTTLGPP